MKKLVLIILILTFALSSAITFADTPPQLDAHIQKSQYFNPDGSPITPMLNTSDSQLDGTLSEPIVPYGSVYTPGTVRIDDRYGAWQGWQTSVQVEGEYDSINTAGMKIFATLFPRTEQVYLVIDFIRKVADDVDFIDPTKNTIITTNYAVRNFRHELYVWDYDDTWYDSGYSLSKLFYRAASTNFIDSRTGQPDTETNQDYDTIAEVGAAPHYMDYSWLTTEAYDCWIDGRTLLETY